MQKIQVVLIVLLSVAFSATAQSEYNLTNAFEFYRSSKLASGEVYNILTEKDIKGSPYLNDDFIKGSIYTVSKTQYEGIPLRYNIYNDEIEFQTDDNKVSAIGTPEILEKVTFGEYTMEYIPYELARNIKKGFFAVLLKGKASLYAKPEVDYQEAKEPEPYKDAEPAKFLRKDDRYYIRLGLEAAISCGSKKDVLAIFPEHSDELETFIKKNKINVKKEDELKQLVEYYNSL